MWRLRNFYYTLRRVWKWLPILWRDRDWDYHFILDIWIAKLRFTREHLDIVRRHVEWKKDVRSLRETEKVLERLKDRDKYVEKDYREYHKKYPVKWVKKGEIVKAEDVGKQNLKKRSRDMREIMKKQKRLVREDTRLLAKLLENHLYSWWD